MNKLATVEKIHSFSIHSNADSLELAKVLGFQVVVRKGEFTDGQTVVFIWPDTICQPAPWNSFLDKDKQGKPIKVKTCKLRQEFSTGVVLPISVLDGYSGGINEGDDVNEFLGVSKYSKDESINAESAGNFPTEFISITDETLAQAVKRTRGEFIGEKVYLSFKIDGQSLTFINFNNEVSVCSRRQKLKDSDNRFWNSVRKYDLIEKTKDLNIGIQAEQYGAGIQKNRLTISGIELAIFNIKDLNDGHYYGLDEMRGFCSSKNIPMVPVFKEFVFDDTTTFESLQLLADELKYPNGSPAEGFVMRPVVSKYSKNLHGPLSVKFINRNYKD